MSKAVVSEYKRGVEKYSNGQPFESCTTEDERAGWLDGLLEAQHYGGA